ncbi:hypothetical protein J3F83DRAFT_757468 [Trichoderma novae-zelandiae]
MLGEIEALHLTGLIKKDPRRCNHLDRASLIVTLWDLLCVPGRFMCFAVYAQTGPVMRMEMILRTFIVTSILIKQMVCALFSLCIT